jgi:tRNA/tmRNA/rRNA uracil-C5-methylase (TrmA/RlmC/RlmD family)
LEHDIKHKDERFPNWYPKGEEIPCELARIIECKPEYRDEYRNKVEFTIGRRYTDNAICVGFNTGNLSKGITFVDYPDGIKTNSRESLLVAKSIEQLVKDSEIEPYDKRTNTGYFRLVLFRESKITNQVLISLVVSENFLVDQEKQTWIENQLLERFKAGTLIGDRGLQVVSLSMIFSNDISGGYKEHDRLKLLSG